jgi:hypothetical protein
MYQPLISVVKASDDAAGERFIVKVGDPLEPVIAGTIINNLTEALVRRELANRGRTPVFADRCLRQARAAFDPRQN